MSDNIVHFLGQEQPVRWLASDLPGDREAHYAAILPDMRAAARRLGYALAVHGSMRRDFDVVAVPWADTHASPSTLAQAMEEAACGASREQFATPSPGGRWTFVLFVGTTAYVDLNVVVPGFAAPKSVGTKDGSTDV